MEASLMITKINSEMMNVNVFGMYYMMKAVLPGMQEKNSGDVVNIVQYLTQFFRIECTVCRNETRGNRFN